MHFSGNVIFIITVAVAVFVVIVVEGRRDTMWNLNWNKYWNKYWMKYQGVWKSLGSVCRANKRVSKWVWQLCDLPMQSFKNNLGVRSTSMSMWLCYPRCVLCTRTTRNKDIKGRWCALTKLANLVIKANPVKIANSAEISNLEKLVFLWNLQIHWGCWPSETVKLQLGLVLWPPHCNTEINA